MKDASRVNEEVFNKAIHFSNILPLKHGYCNVKQNTLKEICY